MEKVISEFGEWSVDDVAEIAAMGCYKTGPCNAAERFAMQIVIENLVLDNDRLGYTIGELAQDILRCLT